MKRSWMKRGTTPMKRTAMRKHKPQPERRTYPTGREVLSGTAWMHRKTEVWFLDFCRCVGCGKTVAAPVYGQPNAAEIHHRFGRGMNGGHRDDRVWIDVNGRQVRNLETRCFSCHATVKIKSMQEELLQ